jgi:sn-glycerol 3-phosphate transport system ATP-binding protein
VFDNMAYGLKIRGLKREEIARRVRESAELLGLGALLARKPRELSGGQRQRVAMGRAIVREPKLFLFDEPLSNLDATLRVSMRAEIRRLQRRMGVTSLYVTHDQVEAMTLGDRLLVLHQGVPVQLATPMEVFERPANLYVAGFIGAPAMNFLDATLTAGGTAAELAGLGTLHFADGRRPGGDGRRLVVGIRPEHVALDDAGVAVAVDLVEPLGSETVLIGRLEAGTMLSVKVQGGPRPTERIRVAFPPAQLHVFDAETGLRLDPAH